MVKNTMASKTHLLDRNQLPQQILDSLTAEVALLDASGTIVAVNKAWTQFAARNGGTERATGVGVNYLNVCRGCEGSEQAVGQSVCAGITQVLDGSSDVFKFEYACHSPSQKRWFLLYASKLDGSDAHVVVTHLQITERKLTELRLVASERLAAIGEAMQGLSHEGRNALQRTQANLALLRSYLEDNGEALVIAEKIEKAQDHLLNLYENVKSYAAPLFLHREPYRLDKIVETVWPKFQSSNPQIRFAMKGHNNDLTCNVDVDAISRVLNELFNNALDECGEAGQIEVAFITDQLAGSPALTMIVSDNGSGIPAENWSIAFQPFFTTKTRGTGLGLAVCRRLVSELDGRIKFGPARLGGASIYVSLPQQAQ